MPFHRAFQLLSDDYNSFILTIESIAVCIYYTHDGKYKIFDSHARDIYGKSNAQGTCVLLEAHSISNLVNHFQSLCSENSQYELKGVIIEVNSTKQKEYPTHYIKDTNLASDSSPEIDNVCCQCRQCCAISLYSICFSLIKPCNIWDSNTVAAVVYFGTILYNNTGINSWSSSDLPQQIEICGTEIEVKLQAI